jgi:hypothetical protein
MQALRQAVRWAWKKITGIDYAMIAAAVVEVPRWAVAFAAIREPWWAAVPMGLLLAWAASAGWKSYFEDKSRKLLLVINATSLVGALVVIAPVLYAMTFQPLDAINLAQILPPNLLWLWAVVLSITTFVPLIQVAAVKAYHPTQTPATIAQNDDAEPAQNDSDIAHQDSADVAQVAMPAPAPARKRAPVVRKRKAAKLSAEQRRAQIAESGVTDPSAIVAQYRVSLRTAQADISAVRAATLAQNGSAHNG